MRPHSIKMFDYLFLASLALGVGNFILSFGEMEAQLAGDPATAGLGSGTLIGVFAFSMAISLLLWFLISRKASKIAKWILIVFTVFSLLMLPASLAGMSAGILVLTLAITALQLGALFYLFKPDAKAYLSGETRDPQTFE